MLLSLITIRFSFAMATCAVKNSYKKPLEPATGFEPVTSPLPRKCSNQLSYVGKGLYLFDLNVLILIEKITKNNFKLHEIVWSWRSDLNRRPADYKSAALPTELRQRKTIIWSGKRDSNPQPTAWKAATLPIELFPHNFKNLVLLNPKLI